MKKILIVILAVIAIAAIALGVYVYFNSRSAEGPIAGDRELFPIIDLLRDLGEGQAGTDDGLDETPPAEENIAPPIRQITREPVAGAAFVDEGGELILRFVDRATGHVFDYAAASSQTVRRSNTTIPRLEEAIFINPTKALLQYLTDEEEIETFSAELTAPATTSGENTPEGSLTGKFLEQNIFSIAVSPSGNVFYLLSDKAGSIGVRRDKSGGAKRILFRSPIREWAVFWPTESAIVLATKPSSFTKGLVFTLDSGGGALKKVMGNVKGLTVLPNRTLDKILYAEGASLRVFLNGSGVSQDLGVRTLPEKCVWGEREIVYCGVPRAVSGELPDSWYQGLTSFADDIVRINTTTGVSDTIASPEDYGESVDAIKLLYHESGHLAFINKKDLSLWLVALPQETTFPRESPDASE